MSEHLNEREFASYIHQSLTDRERTTLDRHLATCSHCQASLSDHQSLQKHIQRSLHAELGTVRSSSRMTFASIAPRLQRHKPAWGRPAQQLASGVLVLVALAIFAFVLAGMFENISRPPSSAGSAMTRSPSPFAAAVAYTASLAVIGDGQLGLLGYDLNPAQPAPGALVTITLYWQAMRELSSDYTMFVYLLDASNRVVAQHDAAPANGMRPTTGWQVGEPVTDAHVLSLPSDLPEGDYWLEVGLYDPTTLMRLGSATLGQAIAITTSILTKCTETYVITPGDTLFGIAQKHGISPQAIQDCNDNALNRLTPGDTIRMPAPLTATMRLITP
jgi:LysM repeat protein